MLSHGLNCRKDGEMKIPNERCEWLMKDNINGGGTTMQDYELAEDLLEARKELSDLRARLKKAVEEIVAYRNSAREKEQFGKWGGLDEALEILDNHGLLEDNK